MITSGRERIVEIRKNNMRTVAVLLVTTLTFLTLIPFITTLHQTLRWHGEAEMLFERRYLLDISSQYLRRIEERAKQLEEDISKTVDALEQQPLNEDAVFERLWLLNPAPSAWVIYDAKGLRLYGSKLKEERFRRTAELALIHGKSGLYGTNQDSMGKAEFAAAAPFTPPEGERLVLVLIYEQSVLGMTQEALELSHGSLALIDGAGTRLAQSGSHPPESVFQELAERNFKAGQILSLSKSENGLSYMAYISETKIKDWRLVLTSSRELTTAFLPPHSPSAFFYSMGAVVLIACFTLLGGYLSYRGNKEMQLFQKKFRIATRQSARAAYEYNKKTDSLKLISESDHVILPKPQLSLMDLGDVVHPADYHLFTYAVQGLRGDGTTSVTLRLLNFDGRGAYRWYTVTGTRLTTKGDGRAITIGTVEDIHERENERLMLHSRATTDCLTGLWNRAETERLVSERISALEGEDCAAFAILDLDSFKNINDAHGHDCGDKALISFSSRLRDIFGRGEILGRLGGDEFMVYMPQIYDKEEIKERFYAFLESISAITVSGHPAIQGLTCSVGCCYARSGDTFEKIYKCADAALYRAKSLQGEKFVQGEE